jgi:hypothetical protein
MANNVVTLFKSFQPGSGKDSSGAAKQGKVRVVGLVNVTSYQGENGEPFSAVDVGLTTIDSIQLRVADAIAGDSTGTERQVLYAKSTGHFYLHLIDAAGAKTQVAAAQTETIEFDALGDSATDVELT